MYLNMGYFGHAVGCLFVRTFHAIFMWAQELVIEYFLFHVLLAICVFTKTTPSSCHATQRHLNLFLLVLNGPVGNVVKCCSDGNCQTKLFNIEQSIWLLHDMTWQNTNSMLLLIMSFIINFWMKSLALSKRLP